MLNSSQWKGRGSSSPVRRQGVQAIVLPVASSRASRGRQTKLRAKSAARRTSCPLAWSSRVEMPRNQARRPQANPRGSCSWSKRFLSSSNKRPKPRARRPKVWRWWMIRRPQAAKIPRSSRSTSTLLRSKSLKRSTERWMRLARRLCPIMRANCSGSKPNYRQPLRLRGPSSRQTSDVPR